MFYLLLMDVFEPDGLIEDLGGVGKRHGFSIDIFRRGRYHTWAMWELQPPFFSLGTGLYSL